MRSAPTAAGFRKGGRRLARKFRRSGTGWARPAAVPISLVTRDSAHTCNQNCAFRTGVRATRRLKHSSVQVRLPVRSSQVSAIVSYGVSSKCDGEESCLIAVRKLTNHGRDFGGLSRYNDAWSVESLLHRQTLKMTSGIHAFFFSLRGRPQLHSSQEDWSRL